MNLRPLTDKQLSVMKALLARKSFHDKPDAERADLDQLIEDMPYQVTKDAFQFTLRSLSKRGYIEKGGRVIRRGKKRVVWALSGSGRKFIARH